MSADSTQATAKKKPLISLPFLIIAVVVLVVGAFYGQTIMEKIFLGQEAKKSMEMPTGAPLSPEQLGLGPGGRGGGGN